MQMSAMVPVSARLAAVLLCGLLAAVPASAIIIRHDTGYDEYFASEAEFPAVFRLAARNGSGTCIATLIDPSWAITAAHCLQETPLQAHLDAGRPYSVEIAGQHVDVLEAVVHERYAPTAAVHGGEDVDLALLRMDRALGIPRPVPLWRQPDELGRVMTFLGWGFHAVGSGGRFMNDGRFRQARNTVTHAGDRLRFRFDDPAKSSDALPLEGLPGTGDSGGPALLFHNGRWHLAGVAVGELARQAEDGKELRQGLYGAVVVYERLSRHQQWIDSVIGPGSANEVGE